MLEEVGNYLGQTLRLMVGVPDYPRYVAHMRENHPDDALMTYEEFVCQRQEARFGNRRAASCC